MLTSQRISDTIKTPGILGLGMGTRDANLKPDYCRVLDIRHIDDLHVQFFFDRKSNPTAIRNVEEGHPIALTMVNATNFESFQFKGRCVKLAACSEEENQSVLTYLHEFNAACVAVGFPDGLIYNYPHSDMYSVLMEVQEIYEQTPKPGTGNKLF